MSKSSDDKNKCRTFIGHYDQGKSNYSQNPLENPSIFGMNLGREGGFIKKSKKQYSFLRALASKLEDKTVHFFTVREKLF